MATDRYEFETTWWNYNFSELYLAVTGTAVAVVAALLAGWGLPQGGVQSTLFSLVLGALVSFLAPMFFKWIHVGLFGGRRPWLMVEPGKSIVARLPQREQEEFGWHEIEAVRIRGRYLFPRIEVTVSRKGLRPKRWNIDYYLFPPEQRREIIALLKRAANENRGGSVA